MLALVRIDDRLIHGQVVVGWGSFLHPDRIILSNDEIARDKSDSELYCMCVPPEIKVSVLSIEDTAKTLINEEYYREKKVILLVDSPQAILKLITLGVKITSVNVGGMHYCEGRHEINSFIYANEKEVEAFKTLKQMGIDLDCRDVPTRNKKSLTNYLEEK